MSKNIRGLWFGSIAFLALACGSAKKPAPLSGLEEYVRQARTMPVDNRENQGSLWTETSSLSDAFRDVKARRVADIVTIKVVEATEAIAEATTESVKQTDAQAGAGSLFGAERHITELPSLISGSSSAQFSGDASTTRSSVLQTTITARIAEVFPNGNLLLEGNREIMINGERQIVTIRGVVRPQDVSPSNLVFSNSIAELEVEVKGRGIVSDAQKPGILYRILTGSWGPFKLL